MNISNIRWHNFFAFRGAKQLFLLLALCLVISSIMGALTPRFIAELSQNYSVEKSFYQSMWNLLYLFIATYINRTIFQLTSNKLIQLMVDHVRYHCYRKWLLSYEIAIDNSFDRDKYPQGEVMARLMSDTESFRELLTSGSFGIFIDIFFICASMASFFSLNLFFGVTLGGLEVLLVLVLLFVSRYMRIIFHKVRAARGVVSQTVANVIGGMSDSYYNLHQSYASRSGRKSFNDFFYHQIRANVWDSGYYSVVESLYPLLLVVIVVLFPYSGVVQAAIIFAVIDLIQRSIGPIKNIAGKIANIQRAITGMERITEFVEDLDRGVSSPLIERIVPLEFDYMEIEIERFEYQKREGKPDANFTPFSLCDISLQAARGEMIGIVGASGGGKSTLLNILAANILSDTTRISLFSSDKNEVLSVVGGERQQIFRYREQVGIVSQDSHIFSETLAFNITLQEIVPEDFAVFWDWVRRKIPHLIQWGIMPEDRIQTNLLSFGQKQLLSAIRSCYLKKTIVLFDEISSGMDSELEQALREVIKIIQKNALIFTVAHRLETIFEADQVVVIDQGVIKAKGTHQVLLDQSITYKELVDSITRH
ncbi:MAG: ABC transporter ATP-binding protein [Bdellovibrionales bacterium]|jgi:ABC-type multidrug transport system fused ATPase/permease subunit|nr:ABC transporter ATP-binding protein [Bdellovibrionales bacterium]MBT3526549.1 ABC transporter ATP-binding protein [Bdellovibrionales bacterium]MBT7767185.1 ABC transporter ATP-binding protein [Bdellovibrionales bacterium]